MWAIKAGKKIVPVVKADDKPRIFDFIEEAKTYAEDRQLPEEDEETKGLAWPDFGKLNFVTYDRSDDLMAKASLDGIVRQGGLKNDVLNEKTRKASVKV